MRMVVCPGVCIGVQQCVGTRRHRQETHGQPWAYGVCVEPPAARCWRHAGMQDLTVA